MVMFSLLCFVGMTRAKYFLILQLLGGRAEAKITDQFTDAENHIAALGVRYGYYPHVSTFTLDDDHLHLRSSDVATMDVKRLHNPDKKAFGPVNHGIVSLHTGLYVCGHVQRKRENIDDVVEILCSYLARTPMKRGTTLFCLFALDRAYQSDSIFELLHAMFHAEMHGTHKRTRNTPVTYNRRPATDQICLTEDGAMVCKWFRRQLHSGPDYVYFAAFRNGLNKIVLMQTTMKEAGPMKWVYKIDTSVPPVVNYGSHPIFQHILEQCWILTQCQGTPEWFVLRRFRITSSVAAPILRRVALVTPSRDDIVPFLTKVLALLGVKISLVAQAEREYTQEELLQTGMTRPMLVEICRAKNVNTSGNKATLISNILSKKPQQDIDSTFLSTWFMKPYSNRNMRIGSDNENYVRRGIEDFIAEFGRGIKVTELFEIGLVCRKGAEYAATSADGIALLTAPDNTCTIAAVEIKTKTTTQTQKVAAKRAMELGEFNSIDIISDAAKFHICVSDVIHRGQVLHHAAVLGVDYVLYVVAEPGHIYNIVLIHVPDDVRATYLQVLDIIAIRHLKWIYNPETSSEAEMPQYANDAYGYASDRDTVRQSFFLWKALVDAKKRGGDTPLPPATAIIPTCIALWNNLKVGIDTFSRQMKNMQPKHQKLKPLSAMWLRLLKIIVYNVLCTYRLLQV